LQNNDAATINIQFVDVYGKVIKNEILTNGSSLRIDLSSFSTGIYFLVVKEGNKSMGTYKLIRY